MENTLKTANPILKLKNINKSFGGIIAAEDISVELYGGKVFGLIGPNGAGKTTLLNVITGIYQADEGSIHLEGEEITDLPTYRRARLGIGRTFQHPRLLEGCDILTNIEIGNDLTNRFDKDNKRTSKEFEDDLNILLKHAGLKNVDLSDDIETLGYGQQKVLEIVRSLLTNPKVLLLDEPVAGMNSREMDNVVALIDVAVERGIAVLLIEHSMDLVMSVCDYLTVLNFGRQIANGVPKEIQSNAVVIEAYLGGGSHVEDNEFESVL